MVNMLLIYGLVEYGFLTIISSCFIAARIQSGIILSLAESPPPITLPARAVEIGDIHSPSFTKKEFR